MLGWTVWILLGIRGGELHFQPGVIAAASHRGEQRVDGEEGCSVQLVKGVLKQFPEGDWSSWVLQGEVRRGREAGLGIQGVRSCRSLGRAGAQGPGPSRTLFKYEESLSMKRTHGGFPGLLRSTGRALFRFQFEWILAKWKRHLLFRYCLFFIVCKLTISTSWGPGEFYFTAFFSLPFPPTSDGDPLHLLERNFSVVSTVSGLKSEGCFLLHGGQERVAFGIL